MKKPYGPYDYSGLISCYLNQSLPSGSTAGNRLSFSKDRLYSYDSLLAKLDTHLYIDKEISKYSQTTSKQVRILESAGRYRNLEIFFTDLLFSLEVNLEDYWEEAQEYIDRYIKARSRKPIIAEELRRHIQHTIQFAELHNLSTTIPDDVMKQMFVYKLL